MCGYQLGENELFGLHLGAGKRVWNRKVTWTPETSETLEDVRD